MRLTLDNGRPRDIDTLMALVDARLEDRNPYVRVTLPCCGFEHVTLGESFVCCAACGEWSDAAMWRVS